MTSGLEWLNKRPKYIAMHCFRLIKDGTPSLLLVKIIRCVCDQRTRTNSLLTRKPDMVVIIYHTVFLESFNVLIGLVRLFLC